MSDVVSLDEVRTAKLDGESGAAVGRRLAKLAIAAVMAERSVLQPEGTAGVDWPTRLDSAKDSRSKISRPVNI